MFTGIVEELGEVVGKDELGDSARFTIQGPVVTADAGHGDHFGHGLGHGVGLQIHEAPGINATAAGTLLPGSVVTVEPGVYLPDRGGVRIEDTLVVPGTTPGHAPELLTRFPKELAIL